jgi:hypothetical protein
MVTVFPTPLQDEEEEQMTGEAASQLNCPTLALVCSKRKLYISFDLKVVSRQNGRPKIC